MEANGPSATRRAVLAGAAAAGGAVLASAASATARSPLAGAAVLPQEPTGPILKPLPPRRFVDFGTNAEMRWDSVPGARYLTGQRRLFVRNHTSTPRLDASAYTLRIFGDGLARPRTSSEALTLSYAQLRRLPRTRLVTTHECAGNGRSFFDTQQGTPASGTPWALGAVGTVAWEGVRLRHLLERIGVSPEAVSVQATGLDDPFVSGGVDYGRVRRPFPVAKALDDALLAWGMNGESLLPDHGFPVRLVLPGWVGVASIKWLGSLEVARRELTSPWNTTFYRLLGGLHPPDGPPLTVNPVRSAWELPWEARLPAGRRIRLTGRSWSGAAPIGRVAVSTDGGATWQRARLLGTRRSQGWTQWEHVWRSPGRGATTLLARATDTAGRTQPDVTPYNDLGYFFDAVVRHPVTVGR